MVSYLIYGSKGWIGSMIVKLLKESNVKFNEGVSRVDDTLSVEKELLQLKPTNVLCFIGRTHGEGYETIDYLEQPGKLVENIKDNLYAPVSLALLTKERNIHLTYIGTGCIFNQNTDEIEDSDGYTEEALPDFFGSEYSTVKGFTDRLMHQLDNVLNIRIRMPIVGYDNPRNFITKIKKYKKVVNVPNSMTVLPDLLPILIDMTQKQFTGTINLTNPGTISHNEILDMHKLYVDPDFEYENFSIEEQNKILASKRSNNKLNTNKLSDLYPDVIDVKSSVEKLLKAWNSR